MDLAAAANWGVVITGFASAGGLFLTAKTISDQARSTDVEAYLQISGEFRESERSFKDYNSLNEDYRTFMFTEHLNRLEGIAHLYFQKRFGRSTKELTKDLLLNHLGTFSLVPEMLVRFESTVTAANTYEYLGKFCRLHKKDLAARRTGFEKRPNN
jgi:hypothetical protein